MARATVSRSRSCLSFTPKWLNSLRLNDHLRCALNSVQQLNTVRRLKEAGGSNEEPPDVHLSPFTSGFVGLNTPAGLSFQIHACTIQLVSAENRTPRDVHCVSLSST